MYLSLIQTQLRPQLLGEINVRNWHTQLLGEINVWNWSQHWLTSKEIPRRQLFLIILYYFHSQK